MFRFQQRFENAGLPKGNAHVAGTCHTNRRVQQRTHSAVSSVGFQPIGWKCNACAAAEPSTSTRQAITSHGGIQRAMLFGFCFIALKNFLHDLAGTYLHWL